MAKTPQTRKEATSVRLEPKIKYLVEIAARIQRRSVTNYIEWALEESLKNVNISIDGTESNLLDTADSIWYTDEALRFAALAENFSDLLTFDEQRMLEVILTFPYLFLYDPASEILQGNINKDELQKHWGTLIAARDGEFDLLENLGGENFLKKKLSDGSGMDFDVIKNRLEENLEYLYSSLNPTKQQNALMDKIEALLALLNEKMEND